jgi:hypothetical protein
VVAAGGDLLPLPLLQMARDIFGGSDVVVLLESYLVISWRWEAPRRLWYNKSRALSR